jgi:UDP-glucose 4-epimerase
LESALNLRGKTVVVIGGAGLIDSHTVDQLLNEDVAKIVVYDNFVRGTYEALSVRSKTPE